MRYYLAYGSNLNMEQMRWRCPTARPVGVSNLAGYELLFKGSQTGAYLTIEEKPGSIVPVAVWRVTKRDEAALDRYEGYPMFYYKKDMTVFVNGRKLDAFVYIMHEDREIGLPTQHYLKTCMEGYEDFGLNQEPLIEALTKGDKKCHEYYKESMSKMWKRIYGTPSVVQS